MSITIENGIMIGIGVGGLLIIYTLGKEKLSREISIGIITFDPYWAVVSGCIILLLFGIVSLLGYTPIIQE